MAGTFLRNLHTVFFLSAHGTFIKIEHTLVSGRKVNKFQKCKSFEARSLATVEIMKN